jgi:hypothetical protein
LKESGALEGAAAPKALEVRKTWSKVKRIAVERIRWKRFTDAPSRRSSGTIYYPEYDH